MPTPDTLESIVKELDGCIKSIDENYSNFSNYLTFSDILKRAFPHLPFKCDSSRHIVGQLNDTYCIASFKQENHILYTVLVSPCPDSETLLERTYMVEFTGSRLSHVYISEGPHSHHQNKVLFEKHGDEIGEISLLDAKPPSTA